MIISIDYLRTTYVRMYVERDGESGRSTETNLKGNNNANKVGEWPLNHHARSRPCLKIDPYLPVNSDQKLNHH